MTRGQLRATARSGLALFMAGAFACSGGGRPGAGTPPESGEDAIQRLVNAAGGDVQLRRSRATGVLAFFAVRSGPGVPVSAGAGAGVEAKAEAFLSEYGGAFGLGELPQLRTIRASVTSDETGQEHVRLQQTLGGIPVSGAEWLVHLKAGNVVTAHGKAVRAQDLEQVETTPRLGTGEAKAAALEVVRDVRHREGTAQEPRLEIWNRGLADGTPGASRLAWFVEVRAELVREYVWVDAASGKVLAHFDQTPRSLAREIRDAGEGWTPYSEMEILRREGDAPTGDADVDRLYDQLRVNYDHYLQRFGRDSYDDAGAMLRGVVRFDFGSPNASWNGWAISMSEGMPGADDVIGHEYGHALGEAAYAFWYSRASGALAEAFADIHGETIDLTNGSSDDTAAVRWLQGEGGFDEPIRNMADPAQFGMPATTTDPLFLCGLDTEGEVHQNSGPMSRAYTLMVDGGEFNGRSVRGIGLDKAERVIYRTITTYLASASGFEEADDGVRQACLDLVGQHGIAADDCAQVGTALDAVELSSGWPCRPTTIHVSVAGQGTIELTRASGTESCAAEGGDCTFEVDERGVVRLVARPAEGAHFRGWSGGCGGGGDTCDLIVSSMGGRLEVSASFEPAGERQYAIDVTLAYSSSGGTGSVGSSPRGMRCSSATACRMTYPAGTLVTLEAAPPAGQVVLDWSGGCVGAGSRCTVLMSRDTQVTVRFGRAPFVVAQVLPSTCEGGAWGDYDADGDLDLLAACSPHPVLYRNDGGVLTDSGKSYRGIGTTQSAAWGDYDGDGDLDLVILGEVSGLDSTWALLERNDAGVLRPAGADLRHAQAAKWGDADGDGDLDLVLVGSATADTSVFYNLGGFLTELGAPLSFVARDLEWVDEDRDGARDLLFTRGDGTPGILANTGELLGRVWFVNEPRMRAREFAIADYDANGYLDIAGTPSSLDASPWTGIFRGETDYATPEFLLGRGGDLAWGDFDADGSPDLLVTGILDANTQQELFTLHANEVRAGGSFRETGSGLGPRLWTGTAAEPAWADVDGDDQLDVLLGNVIYRNDISMWNGAPHPPASLSTYTAGDAVVLSWSEGSDAETPAAGLTYNVRVGTTPTGSEVVSAMADPVTGFHRVVGPGNAAGTRQLLLRGLAPGRYYWAVQSIDASFAASRFSATATLDHSPQVLIGRPVSVGGTGTVVRTEPTSAASSYRIEVSGVYTVGNERYADAYWESDDSWFHASPDHTVPGTGCPIGLYVNGMLPNWGPFDFRNRAHEYSTVVQGTGQPFELQAMDCPSRYGDNSGALRVTITRVE